MKKYLSLLLVATLLWGVLTGCQHNQDSSAKDTLTMIGVAPCEVLLPVAGGNPDRTVMGAIFDSLLKFDANGDVVPCLAESYSVSDDSLTFTFKLRQDVKFHDGSPFTADDVVFTLDTMMAQPQFASFGLVFASWEKIDDYTVTITRPTVYANVPGSVAQALLIISKDAYTSDPEGYSKNPFGTGAYKFVSQDADLSVTLEANEDYFLGTPAIKKAVIKPPIEGSTAVVSLERGEVDLITSVPGEQLSIITGNDDLELVESESWSSYLMFQLGARLRDDPNLRKAISLGVDKQNVADMVGSGAVPQDLLPSKMMGDLAGKVSIDQYDSAAAKEYLAKSDYDGTPILLTVTAAESTMAQVVQANLKDIGIEVEIETLDINAWATKLLGGELELTICAFGGNTSSPENALVGFGKNDMTFGVHMAPSDEFESVIDQIQKEVDADKREVLAQQGLEIQAQLANVVPILNATAKYAKSKSLTGVPETAAALNIYYIADWSFQ